MYFFWQEAFHLPCRMTCTNRSWRVLEGKGVMIVVDATKDLLLNVLKYHPFLIKPNNHELGEIFGVELKTREEVDSLWKETSGKRCQKCSDLHGWRGSGSGSREWRSLRRAGTERQHW